MIALQLSVHVRYEDVSPAEKKGYKGATVDIGYQAVPRVGDFFSVHPAVEPLQVIKVTHWGPGFDCGSCAEIHFYAPLSVIETLLASTKKEVEEEWEPEDL